MRSSTLLAGVATALPGIAWACPACARDSSPSQLLFIGSMIVLPFVVVGAVIRVMRRGESRFEP
jgi:hypothetical protein